MTQLVSEVVVVKIHVLASKALFLRICEINDADCVIDEQYNSVKRS